MNFTQSIEFGKAHIMMEMRKHAEPELAGMYWYLTIEDMHKHVNYVIAGLLLDGVTIETAFPPTQEIVSVLGTFADGVEGEILIAKVSESLTLAVCKQANFDSLRIFVAQMVQQRKVSFQA